MPKIGNGNANGNAEKTKDQLYLIRVEHKKYSEMCVRIVRFGLKLMKWDYFFSGKS